MSTKLEWNLVGKLAERLPDLTKTRWDSCHSSHRFLAYQGKELVVYTVFNGRPTVLDTLVCRSVGLSTDDGFTSEWRTTSGALFSVSHTPVEILPYCFLWHAFDCQVRYYPYNGKFSTSFPLMYRTRSNPTRMNEDHTYILEQGAFSAAFEE